MHRTPGTEDCGLISIVVLSVEDDQTADEDIGFRIVNLGPATEFNQELFPRYDIDAHGSENDELGSMDFMWLDTMEDRQQPIRERIAVYAVDLAGNVSVQADTLEISVPDHPRHYREEKD